MAARPTPPAECAVCGAAIPRRARACPECGADERTGWREQSIYDGLDLPDEETPDRDRGRPGAQGPAWYWLVAGVVTLVALIFLVLGLR